MHEAEKQRDRLLTDSLQVTKQKLNYDAQLTRANTDLEALREVKRSYESMGQDCKDLSARRERLTGEVERK